ncbi:MAG TPA: tRNA-dihydrouridine synthase family protein [Tepidisphaeraceae bacterium]|nr:tRNA-dihydrouridine synthase family protein [Tepidisphaeraceae bacterium]
MNIGPIQLPIPFCQAGLAGYSDRAMRVVARRRGCPYAVTEALLDTIMLSGGMGLKKSIDIDDEDHPVAGQIIGSEPDTMSRAAIILAERGYDVIDLNFACPVKKIKNKSRGGHMLRDVERGISILKAVRDVLPPNIPTTISIRRGFDDSPESVDLFHEIIESAWSNGYSAIRVHARTVEQKYAGLSRWEFLRKLKAMYPNRTILGSGDVFTAEDAVRMLKETGVDIVWIARGAIGNPWIFNQAASLLALRPLPLAPPSIHEQRDALQEHFAIAMQIHGEQLAGRRMRKMGIKYARFHTNAVDVKTEFINVRSLRDWNDVLNKWYASDGRGLWPDPRAADEVNDALEESAAQPACQTSA